MPASHSILDSKLSENKTFKFILLPSKFHFPVTDRMTDVKSDVTLCAKLV